MTIIPRETYSHPGPLGPSIDLSRITGWDIHHTAGSLDETPRGVAQTGVNRFGRSSYNFLVSQKHSPGDVWEMQGLHIGAHNDGENSTRLGIVFPGYYHPSVNHRPTDEQVWAAAWLMAHGHREWGIPIHAKGHRDSDNTACPGDHLQALIPDIVRRAKENPMAAGHSPIDKKAHSLSSIPSWSPWQEYVDAGGTSVPESGVFPVFRADLAWYWKRFLVPMSEKINRLQSEVSELRSALDSHKADHVTGDGTPSDTVADHVHAADGTTGGVKR